MDSKEKIREIAEKVRKSCLKKYKSRFPDTLEGCCSIASGRLFKELSKNGFHPIIVEVDNDSEMCCHCFIICNGYLVDITATQFDQDPICIFRRKIHNNDQRNEFWYWYWKKRIYYHSVHELKKKQLRDGWDKDQVYWSRNYKCDNG
jgi:hypothetical protein